MSFVDRVEWSLWHSCVDLFSKAVTGGNLAFGMG